MVNLTDRIQAGEGTEMEFKVSLPSESVKWLKTVVAFANGSGGMLIIGVEDNGTVVGVPEDSAFKLCDSIVSSVIDSCVPQISISPSVKRIDDMAVVIVDVFPGNGRPYHIKDLGEINGTFVRIGRTTRLADEFKLQELRLQGTNRTFDTIINNDIQVTDERTEAICRSLSADKNAAVDENTLLNAGVIVNIGGKKTATNAYALLSEDSPFRFTEVCCAVFKGVKGTEFIDRANYACPIQSQIENAFAFVKRNIRLGGKVDGLYREDKYELPIESIRELIVNAVQHRSYIDPTKPVYVAIYDNRIEITSPGGLPYSLSVEMMRQSRSAHRNPAISTVFRAAKLSEGWGNGVMRVFDECRLYGLPDPEIENSGVDVRVTVYRQFGGDGGNLGGDGGNLGGDGGDQTENSNVDQRKRIMSAMIENPGMTAKDLSASTGIPRRTVERHISDLKKEGIIIRTGNTRTGQWIVKRQ